MLYDIEKNLISYTPHRVDFDRWRRNLTDEDYDAIIDELHQIFDNLDEPVFNSSFLPGSIWDETVYQPIYEAVGANEDVAALFYGLIVWEAVRSHEGEWFFVRQNRDDDRPIGLTYFQKRG